MWKKVLLAALSLLLLLAGNLYPCCSLEINGRALPGVYSRQTLQQAEAISRAAAEELLAGPAVGPELEKHWSLSLLPPKGGRRYLTDSLLCAHSGLKKGDGVSVNGVFLGTVADGALLQEKARDFVRNQMPNAAVFGSISGRLSIDTVYTRRNHDTPYEDMLLLISGMAPVVYTDAEGRLV